MKRIIVIFQMCIFTFAYPCSPVQRSKIAMSKMLLEKVPFLTSFIVDDQLYLNIPEQVLDKPVLFVRYDHIKERKYMQIILSLHRDKIILKVPSIKSTAGVILPIKKNLAIESNILAIFPLEKIYGKKDGFTINITELILRQEIEWTPGFTESLAPQITLLMDNKNLDDEVIIKTRRGVIIDKSKIAVPVVFVFCALGETMKARPYDFRMGFYNELSIGNNFGIENMIANITRWKLEKKYKNQEVSVPVKPITYLMSPKIPKKWRSYIKAGIEEWLPAFESAGFREALVVKELDSLTDWQAYSISNSIIYWDQRKYLRGAENEDFGGTISKIIDLRSGEILKCDIQLGSSPQALAEGYFIRAAPIDKRAQKFPFPDELIGALFQRLAAHEAGHAFGIMDGNFGEYNYSVDKIRDSIWLRHMGYTPSIMNYTRSNNIPQPCDKIPPTLLLQHVGPTDIYNIKWAYKEFPSGTLPKEEEVALEKIIRWQDSIPWYRYNNSQFEVIGPAASNEVVETRDPVESTEMALKNIRNVIELLPKVSHDQKDNARLERLYNKTLELWYHHMSHVATLIGGYEIHYKSINQPGNLYSPIPWKDQERSLDFLIINAFNPPNWLVHPEFESTIKYSTFPDRLVGYQQRLILDLIDSARIKRLENMENTHVYQGALNKYLTMLQLGLFKELRDEFGHVSPRNQEIQMTYLDKLLVVLEKERINFYPESKYSDYTDYSKSLLMERLMSLREQIENRIKNNKKLSSLGHWRLCLNKINRIN